MLSAAEVARVDRSGMIEHVRSLPDQVRAGFRAGLSIDPGPAHHVVFAGMGGSAIAADVFCAFARDRSEVPLEVLRGYEPPAYLGEGDALVAVSYSGGTEETLQAAQIALRKGCRVVAVTSGGPLRDLSKAHGVPVVSIPAGMPPRAAFGHLFGSVAGLSSGWVTREAREGVDAAASHLEQVRVRLDVDVPVARNPAKAIARWLRGRTAVVYGPPPYGPVALRWKTQLNENAKVHAFAGAFPEMDHNEIEGWANDPAVSRFAPILLRDRDEAPEMQRRIDATRTILARRGRVREVRDDGDSLLGRLLGSLLVGDYASVYLAALLRRDPTPTSALEALKRRLAH